MRTEPFDFGGVSFASGDFDVLGVVVNADAVSVQGSCCDCGGTGSDERVEDDVARVCGHQDDAFQEMDRELAGMGVTFLAVPYPVDVGPNVTDQRSERMALVALPAIVFVEFATFSALWMWGANFVELEASVGLGVEEYAVVSGKQCVAERRAHGVPSDPVFEVGDSVEVIGEVGKPLWDVVNDD